MATSRKVSVRRMQHRAAQAAPVGGAVVIALVVGLAIALLA